MQTTITREEIKGLSAWYRVAFAVRCANRLRRLFELPDETPNRPHHMQVVDQVLEYAREFTDGTPVHDDESKTAAKATSSVYSEMVMTAKGLSARSLPRARDYRDFQALARAYEIAGDYLLFAVAAEEMNIDDEVIEYGDDSAFQDYEYCATLWGFQSQANDAACSDFSCLNELQAKDPVGPVPNEFFDRSLWPNGEPHWDEVIERHQRVVRILGRRYASSRKVLEVFDGFVERVDGEVAYISLKPETGHVSLFGSYPAKELAAQGISERRRFRFRTVDFGNKVDVELESVPDREVPAERQRAIQQKIREALGGDDFDGDS